MLLALGESVDTEQSRCFGPGTEAQVRGGGGTTERKHSCRAEVRLRNGNTGARRNRSYGTEICVCYGNGATDVERVEEKWEERRGTADLSPTRYIGQVRKICRGIKC